MITLRQEINLFLLALGFLTRIPIPFELNYNSNTLNASSRYFCAVGALIGACMAFVFYAASAFLPLSVAVIFTLIFNLLLTGCFHQDGLADMADGFGGAFEIKRKLEIMKDSRLGTYGSCALIGTLGLQYTLLTELHTVAPALIIGQAISRGFAASIIYDTPYAADPDASKAKPLSTAMTRNDMLILATTAGGVLLFLNAPQIASVILSLWVVRILFKRFIIAQIRGYTGDCLGAGQQISEACIYIVLLIWQGVLL